MMMYQKPTRKREKPFSHLEALLVCVVYRIAGNLAGIKVCGLGSKF